MTTADVLPPAPTLTDVERRIAFVAIVLLLLASLTAALHRDASAGPVADLGSLPTDVAPPPYVEPASVSIAQASAGCTLLVDGEPMQDRNHLDPDQAPPAAELYPDHRPAHSGRHFPGVVGVLDRVAPEPIDERAVLHNMEHGSVVVWFDPDQLDARAVGEVQAWLRDRLAVGFVSRSAGAVFASPSPDIASGQAVALRAWGVALDCDRFDVTVADGFLQAHWGSHGASPEAHLSPFPVGVFGEVGDAV